MAKEKKPKERPKRPCAFCYNDIQQIGVDGGKIKIPTVLSYAPAEEVFLHNGCVNGYIAQVEKNRPKFARGIDKK